ncbi:DUF288 domain-containing protein [Geomonas oryzisoli]|uniref:DUF288 domain-containing protein n=1 Tax=Geomonas oryzisoli TaxID=2847992 RepID=A0ABX8JBA9_9BACT|nr:STELLO glycosyltransferase family protein [Geomonas oryzisoli]QWV95068.1 DUF288 domain-containing protein [Geomonas oryzisoli]
MTKKTSLIITTINEPSVAVKAFSAIDGLALTVVGDKKTPQAWSCANTTYLPVDAQQQLGYAICRLLPYHHYARKNVGYLHAMKCGAEVIIDTDDDNVPKEGWGFPAFSGDYLQTPRDHGFVNVYSYFTDQHIWPRGFPLNLIRPGGAALPPLATGDIRIGVWQGLADGDPDVDAIYRLVLNKPCTFKEKEPLVLAEGTICPFNSQNTAFAREAFPLLYLPSFVTFRYTDILRGLVAQPIMWRCGLHLGFTQATVVQERNPHDYMQDFVSEIPCYLHADEVVEVVCGALRGDSSVADNLYLAYDALRRKGIVMEAEMELLSLWLKDLP